MNRNTEKVTPLYLLKKAIGSIFYRHALGNLRHKFRYNSDQVFKTRNTIQFCHHTRTVFVSLQFLFYSSGEFTVLISTAAALSPNLFPPPVLGSAILSTCIHRWATLVGLDSAILSPSAWEFWLVTMRETAYFMLCSVPLGHVTSTFCAVMALSIRQKRKEKKRRCFVYGRNCKTDFPLGDKLRRGARSRWSEGDLPLICLPPPPTPKIKALINGISLFLFLQIPLPLLYAHQTLIG